MKIQLYAIKDTLIGFTQPFAMHSKPHAIRQFTNSVNAGQNNEANVNPEHKELWYIGEYDDQTGHITTKPEFAIKAMDVLERRKDDNKN